MDGLINRKPSVLVVAHRAAAPGCPENSLAGIRAAAESGADVVEVDVRRTIDGVPVLLHDPILGRRTDGRGLVRLARARRIAERRLVGSGETVPTLDDALAALPDGVAIGVHVKDRGVLAAVLSVIERRGMAHRSWLLLERSHDVGTVRRWLPGARVLLLNDWAKEPSVERYLATAEVAGATAVSIPWGRVAPESTGDAHRRGLLVLATEKNPSELLAKVAAGLDGVTTDDPARAAALLGSRGRRGGDRPGYSTGTSSMVGKCGRAGP